MQLPIGWSVALLTSSTQAGAEATRLLTRTQQVDNIYVDDKVGQVCHAMHGELHVPFALDR